MEKRKVSEPEIYKKLSHSYYLPVNLKKDNCRNDIGYTILKELEKSGYKMYAIKILNDKICVKAQKGEEEICFVTDEWFNDFPFESSAFG